MISPLGLRPTSLMLEKSTPTIMGKIIAQISTATTRLTEAYSRSAMTPTAPGATTPSARPARMAPSTHNERKRRSEEHTSELQSLMRTSYAVICLKKKKTDRRTQHRHT